MLEELRVIVRPRGFRDENWMLRRRTRAALRLKGLVCALLGRYRGGSGLHESEDCMPYSLGMLRYHSTAATPWYPSGAEWDEVAVATKAWHLHVIGTGYP
jgi:hypothetical protein